MISNKILNKTMTQEEKDLLLKDLCARLAYGVKIRTIEIWTNKSNKIEILKDIFIPEDNIPRCGEGGIPIEYIKPYLFPMSSMTKEQKIRIRAIQDMGPSYYHLLVDEYNEWHIDYRGLIPKKLAIDATDLNIY